MRVETTVNITDAKVEKETEMKIYFVVASNYQPSVATITVKGEIHVVGTKQEIDILNSGYDKGKEFPTDMVASMSDVVLPEMILFAKSLMLPPPIPLSALLPLTRPPKIDYSA